MDYVYPAIRYRVDDPLKYRVVSSLDDDKALGPDFEDPYGIRSESADDDAATVDVPIHRPRGRRPRVSADDNG